MVHLLGRDVAQVDLCKFEKVGAFHDVYVIPNSSSGSVFATKTMAVDQNDKEHDFQHCLYITLNLDACELTLDESLVAHTLYEDDDGNAFVDASYSFEMGILTLQQYFLMPVDECEFAATMQAPDGDIFVSLTLAELRSYGLLVRI